jgi:flagellar motility protein MotE (MotC chaperone)
MTMLRTIRDLRLIPIALIASACLLVLKLADLAFDSSRLFASNDTPAAGDSPSVIRTSPGAPQPPNQKLSWAQQMFNFPTGSDPGEAPAEDIAPPPVHLTRGDAPNTDATNPDITGAITQGGPAAAPGATPGAVPGAPAAQPPPNQPDGVVIPMNGAVLPSGAEQKILERLQERREQLDARARELDIRENLVKAAEQRIEAHLTELKEVEARIKTETQDKDKAEAKRFKDLVTMYENMKPRDAAKIFDGLDMDVLIQVSSEINPRAMADIMAQMTPEIAERLTVALASKAQSTAKNDPTELPKIQGQPTAQ